MRLNQFIILLFSGFLLYFTIEFIRVGGLSHEIAWTIIGIIFCIAIILLVLIYEREMEHIDLVDEITNRIEEMNLNKP